MAEESVKVAVRCRPFNKREIEAKSKLIVSMNGPQTIIKNPQTNEEKKYAYDYSYWSHDGSVEEADGYFSPAPGSKYADQKKVYNDLGVGVLKNAWEGFNASLFAYGQTGSGKSYSVVGYGANKGIVPMVSEEIFKTSATITDKTIEVYFSMLEIYSEVVRDLLNPKADRKQGLEIRLDQKNGFYAQGLTKKLVTSYEGIVKLTDEGTANRTIAATNMNATSSRAHTIVAMTIIQKYKNEAGQEMAKTSIINLVDLAGSERADSTGATGERLKEGAAINLSLSSLGNVISALADNCNGKKVNVPYRDSSLTKLLMNALGGNSKTIMIAAVSPADINFEESVSTLRYADRAKQIKTKAMVNEDPTEKLIRDLKSENERLKKMLASGNIDASLLQNNNGTDNVSNEEIEKEKELMKKQLEENEREMEAMNKSYEEKLAAALAAAQKQGLSQREINLEKAKTMPHFTNINMDPSLSDTIKHILEGEGTKTIGVAKKADIGLNGIGILDPHCAITVSNGTFKLERFQDAKVLINGVCVVAPVELHHLDRVLFGCSQYYSFIDPSKASANDKYYTFEMAQEEIAKESGVLMNTKNMTQEEILCMTELMELMPSIDEANHCSITLDKKVKFSALAVSSAARGDYDARAKAFVQVKNFALGLEWIWTKEKFLNRKSDMTDFLLDFKEDGKIDKDKYAAYDPFYESPDTETQVGSAMLYPKSFVYMISFKGDFKILDFKSKEAGIISVEVLPCTADGKVIDPSKGGKIIKHPETDLLNKNISFIININIAYGLDEKFEDIYCKFQLFNDPNEYKTDVIRGTNKPNFKYSKKFDVVATKEFLDYAMNKPLYIQVWSEQKHPDPLKINNKITTREYFERERETNKQVSANVTNKIDPEKQKLLNDLSVYQAKDAKNSRTIQYIKKLVFVAKERPIPGTTITALLNAQNDDEAESIIKGFFITISNDPKMYEQYSQMINTSEACNIL